MPPSYESLLDNALALQQQGENKLPPVESWHPPLSGDMPLLIRRDGQWLHEGAVIEREALVRLFACILKREGDEYFLVTPVEKWRIQVEDVPFQVTSLEVLAQGTPEQALVFTTNTGDKIVASADSPLRVISDSDSGEPSPYLRIRRNLEGKLTRAVFYQLAALAKPGGMANEKRLGVISRGVFFALE